MILRNQFETSFANFLFWSWWDALSVKVAFLDFTLRQYAALATGEEEKLGEPYKLLVCTEMVGKEHV